MKTGRFGAGMRIAAATAMFMLLAERAIAEPPRVIVEWPTLPRQQVEPPAIGPVEPAATRSDVPRIGSGRAAQNDDDRRLREREEAARERVRAALDEQAGRVGGAVSPPLAGPAVPVQNCGPAGCFDAQGRFLPRAGPTLITPSGLPCVPSPSGSGC